MKAFAAAALVLTTLALGGCGSVMEGNAKGDGTGVSSPSFAQFTDVPVPAGARMDVNQTLLLGNGESWIGRLVFSSWSSHTSMYDFYKSEMPGFGWTEITSVRASISVQTWQRDSRICTIQIDDELIGSGVILTMAPSGTGGASGGGSYAPPAPAAASRPSVSSQPLR